MVRPVVGVRTEAPCIQQDPITVYLPTILNVLHINKVKVRNTTGRKTSFQDGIPWVDRMVGMETWARTTIPTAVPTIMARILTMATKTLYHEGQLHPAVEVVAGGDRQATKNPTRQVPHQMRMKMRQAFNFQMVAMRTTVHVNASRSAGIDGTWCHSGSKIGFYS